MDDAEKKLSLKRKRSAAKGQFHTIYIRLTRVYNAGENLGLLHCMIGDLESAYRTVEGKYLDYFEELDESDEQDKQAMTAANGCLETLYNKLCKARALTKPVDDVKKSVVPLHKEKDEHNSENTSAADPPNKETTEHKKANPSLIRVKLLDPPSYSGGVKEYPSFKHDFETHMIPTYGKDHYALKKCLSGDALSLIQGIDDDYDKMMLRLEDRFGRPEKLVDEILCELGRLKPVAEDDCKRFITLVQTVENCWLNMNRVNLSDEMSSVAIISQIEKLLPPTQLREWAKLKLQSNSSIVKDQFGQLLDFLIQEKRRAMEYIQKMLGDG